MRNFVKTRFFTVIAIAAMLLTIVPTVLSVMGLGDYVKNTVNVMLTPVQKLFTYATDAVDGFVDYFTEFDRIVAENEQLREEISQLRDQTESAKEVAQMNEWLYDYLELKREHTDYSFEAANVTGRESGNYMTVFTLDKGTSQGVRANMPVMTADGLVGYVQEAGSGWSKAVTILESGSAIGAYVERSGEVGVIEGDYKLASEGVCLLKYLPADTDIQAGDRILSSGYGSVYPRGLVIGYVSDIKNNANSRTKDVYVTPGADLSDISRLMVITDYDTYTEE